ncbi:eukaryotic translation initiation factor 2A-like [Tropilaelaps mercedesae]|uniref:Eukaryotic translation initiation factor 2A n=1 Tax=Tropilaelaps mercedesae TaxID=418985 RepID=A0A1V9XDN0_9ACAR|nr:eukaryotic translation initiation factor 2A-like [Tropilaelaps mercedesae]
MAADVAKFVYTCGNSGLLVYSLDDRLRASLKQKLDDQCKLFEQSGDGKILAYANRKGVHLVETPSLKSIRSLPFERVQGIQFSPKSTFLAVFCPYLCKPNEQPAPNLFIVNCSSGETIHSYVQRRQTGWEPHWFADESYMARAFSNTVMFYEPVDMSKHAKQINIPHVADICLSPSIGKKFLACYISPSSKAQPAFCRIHNIDQPNDALASKSFFKCDSVSFKWNAKGTDLLILAINEVDKTNTSYYGEQTLHYANVKGDSCFVQLNKAGAIHHTEWGTDSFCVVYGAMPARATIFNLKCDPVWDLQEGPRNLACFNPHGNILLIAGFGNLQGTVETWDVEQRKRISVMKIPDTTHLEFAPDGMHFLTATLAPRLRVNNGFKVWHYSGALKTEIISMNDDCDSFDEMWQAQIHKEPASEYARPTIVFEKVEGVAQSAPQASTQVYRPPSVRALEKVKKEEKKKSKNKKKPKTPKVPETPVVEPTIDASLSKLDEDDRKARAIKKKLSQIYVLKQRSAAGEPLESEQMDKIAKERELLDELKQLEL